MDKIKEEFIDNELRKLWYELNSISYKLSLTNDALYFLKQGIFNEYQDQVLDGGLHMIFLQIAELANKLEEINIRKLAEDFKAL